MLYQPSIILNKIYLNFNRFYYLIWYDIPAKNNVYLCPHNFVLNMNEYYNLAIVTLLTFIVNMPFGYWRASVKKFSWKWFLAVHLPIPLVVFMRFHFHLGFQFYTYPFLVGAFFFGQFVGAKYYLKRKKAVSEAEEAEYQILNEKEQE